MMKKITILLFAMIMSLGANAQDELLFDGSDTAPGQQFFRQGPSWGTVGKTKGATDDGTGNMVIEITRTNHAGAAWHVLPLVDGTGEGVARSIGDGGTFAAIRLKVRTTKNGNATISARIQNGTVRATDVTVTGGDGTAFGEWQTIILNCTTFPAANKRPEFYVDPFDSTTLPDAEYKVQFDDIEVLVPESLSTETNVITNLAVYPNPTTDKITIATNEKFSSVSVYDIVGKMVKTFNNTKVINVSDLNAGVYFLKTDTGLKAKFVKN